MILHAEPLEILEYLPIRRNITENNYINHLSQAFNALDAGGEVARPFALMPFHLLFMMAIQYKILRIYNEHENKYNLACTIKNPRDGEREVLNPESPLAIAFLGESEIVDFLKIAGLARDDVKTIKKNIVRYRNDKIAHAKGFIEEGVEEKILEYFNALEIVQNAYHKMNKNVINGWIKEIDDEEDEDNADDIDVKVEIFEDFVGNFTDLERKRFQTGN